MPAEREPLAGDVFSARVERALRIAADAHEGQQRKGLGRVPYVTHPMHVALILARLGASETELVAALLHDVVEDSPDWSLAELEREFGSDVRELVAELTEDKDLSWEQRKRAGIEQVRALSPRALTIKAADKLHNLSSLVADLRASDEHDLVWSEFNGGRERTLAMSEELVRELVLRADERLSRALRAVMNELKQLARR